MHDCGSQSPSHFTPYFDRELLSCNRHHGAAHILSRSQHKALGDGLAILDRKKVVDSAHACVVASCRTMTSVRFRSEECKLLAEHASGSGHVSPFATSDHNDGVNLAINACLGPKSELARL